MSQAEYEVKRIQSLHTVELYSYANRTMIERDIKNDVRGEK